MTDPQDCRNMAELRGLIDALDRDLVRLLARRQACIARAADLKRVERLPALIPDRVDEVLGNVAASARAEGLDPELAAALWRQMIDWSVAWEARRLGEGDEG